MDCSMCNSGMYNTCKYLNSKEYKEALVTIKEKKANKLKEELVKTIRQYYKDKNIITENMEIIKEMADRILERLNKK